VNGTDVLGKVTALREGLRALGALVGPFARVGADVLDKVTALREGLRALGALVGPFVRAFMLA